MQQRWRDWARGDERSRVKSVAPLASRFCLAPTRSRPAGAAAPAGLRPR